VKSVRLATVLVSAIAHMHAPMKRAESIVRYAA
jgi:hypothetical protein